MSVIDDLYGIYMNILNHVAREIRVMRIDLLPKPTVVKRNRRDGSGSFQIWTWGSVMVQIPAGMGTITIPIQKDGRWTSMKVDIAGYNIDYREDRKEQGGTKTPGNGYLILPVISFDKELPTVPMPKYRDKNSGLKRHSTWIVNAARKPVMDEIGRALTDIVRAFMGVYVLPKGPTIGLYNGRPMPSSCTTCKHLVNFRTFAEDQQDGYPYILPNPGLPTMKDDHAQKYVSTFCGMNLRTVMEEAFEIWNESQELDRYEVKIEKKDGTGFYYANAGFGTNQILFGNRLMDWPQVKETVGRGDVCPHYRFFGLKSNGVWANVPPAPVKMFSLIEGNNLREGFPQNESELLAANTGVGLWVTVHPAYTKHFIGAKTWMVEPEVREYNIPVELFDSYKAWLGVMVSAIDDNSVGAKDKSDILLDTLDDVLLLIEPALQRRILEDVLGYMELDQSLIDSCLEYIEAKISDYGKIKP